MTGFPGILQKKKKRPGIKHYSFTTQAYKKRETLLKQCIIVFRNVECKSTKNGHTAAADGWLQEPGFCMRTEAADWQLVCRVRHCLNCESQLAVSRQWHTCCVHICTTRVDINKRGHARYLTRIWMRSWSASCRNCSSSLIVPLWFVRAAVHFKYWLGKHTGLHAHSLWHTLYQLTPARQKRKYCKFNRQTHRDGCEDTDRGTVYCFGLE